MRNIYDALKRELSQADTIEEVIRELDEPFERIDFDDVREKVEQRIQEACLSIEKTTLVTVLLGCGGPTEYFEIELDSDGDPTRGKYVNTGYSRDYNKDQSDEGDYRTEIDLSSDEVDVICQRYGLTEG